MDLCLKHCFQEQPQLSISYAETVNCVQVYLNRVPNDRNRLLVPCMLDPPNPKCYVCAPKPEVTVVLNCARFKVGTLQDKVSVCVVMGGGGGGGG